MRSGIRHLPPPQMTPLFDEGGSSGSAFGRMPARIAPSALTQAWPLIVASARPPIGLPATVLMAFELA